MNFGAIKPAPQRYARAVVSIVGVAALAVTVGACGTDTTNTGQSSTPTTASASPVDHRSCCCRHDHRSATLAAVHRSRRAASGMANSGPDAGSRRPQHRRSDLGCAERGHQPADRAGQVDRRRDHGGAVPRGSRRGDAFRSTFPISRRDWLGSEDARRLLAQALSADRTVRRGPSRRRRRSTHLLGNQWESCR